MCGILLLVILQGQACVVEMQGHQEYVCECGTSHLGQRSEWRQYEGTKWSCPGAVASLQIWDFEGSWKLNRTVATGWSVRLLCRFGRLGANVSDKLRPEFDCSLGGVTAPMLKESCEADELDIVKFQMCRMSVPQFFLGVCDGAYTVCAVLDGDMRPRKVALLIYLFLPLCCLLGLILVHLVAFLARSSLTRIQENTTLRKQVKQKSQIYQAKLQNGNLEHSIWCLGIAKNWFILKLDSLRLKQPSFRAKSHDIVDIENIIWKTIIVFFLVPGMAFFFG